MRPFIAVIAAALALACAGAQATSSLSFEAQGYLIDIVVGDAAGPAVSQLSIARPGGTQPTALPLRDVTVQTLDARRQILRLRYRARPADAAPSPSFQLRVRGDKGTLDIGGQSLAGRFSWGS